jgi:hypothetical protein
MLQAGKVFKAEEASSISTGETPGDPHLSMVLVNSY